MADQPSPEGLETAVHPDEPATDAVAPVAPEFVPPVEEAAPAPVAVDVSEPVDTPAEIHAAEVVLGHSDIDTRSDKLILATRGNIVSDGPGTVEA